MENKTVIEFDNVTFTYDSEDENGNILAAIPAIEGVNLKVNKGEFVAVLGHNGSGKSTLAKLCNAIYEPTIGKVFVNGMDTSDEDKANDIRKTVGMVFQNPDNQIVATIVEDDVAFGPENLGVEPAEIRRRVDDALKTVGMYDYRLREPHKLSGGQKQRVAIAGVLAMQTECIVLDEPTAMLDPRGREEVMNTVHRLNREMGITVLLITHFMDEAVKADRVVVMDNGKIAMNSTPREVFSLVERVKSLKLDVPQSTELCYMLGIKSSVLNVNECVDAVIKEFGGDRV